MSSIAIRPASRFMAWVGPRLPALGRLGTVATLGVGIAFAVGQVAGFLPFAFDAGAYWAATPGQLYIYGWENRPDGYAPFLYSPAFADALIPFRMLPDRVFAALWQLGLFGALAVVARGWSIVFIVMAIPSLLFDVLGPLDLVLSDIAHGNVQVFLGAVAVAGLRYPWLWSFALLTKVTPGVGLLWFVARREWRHLGVAILATAAIATVSFLYLPGDWFDWTRFLIASQGQGFPIWVVPIALPIRLAMSAALVWWGARSDRRWVVPLAVGWAIPMPYPTMVAAMVFAVPLLVDDVRRRRQPSGALRTSGTLSASPDRTTA